MKLYLYEYSIVLFLVPVLQLTSSAGSDNSDFCHKEDEDCKKYSLEYNHPETGQPKDKRWDKYLNHIKLALETYEPCSASESCSRCHRGVIKSDLEHFKDGITREMITSVASKGTKYQIIDHKLYRQKDCMFPGRCAGIEYFLKKLLKKLPNMDLIINTRDWPQLSKHFSGTALPVFSFSKTKDYYDITYPAWSFWEGGPAIKLYPKGLGQWGKHLETLSAASEAWPWDKKLKRAFFRGSRTSAERDPLVLLSRERPELVDAQYTKNQAWKSEADTLNAPPADEVSLEDHCKYRYLFNFRGVAASFRFKHLFLCGSLVFHVGDEWTEFFYHKMKPWIHYIPVDANASIHQIRELIQFAVENDDAVWEIAEQGRLFIENHLRVKDVTCYWSLLLKKYAKLLKYESDLDTQLILIA